MLEIGRNSVSPWTIPRTMASNADTGGGATIAAPSAVSAAETDGSGLWVSPRMYIGLGTLLIIIILLIILL